MMIVGKILFTLAAAVVFCELVGYWLHILLHSDKIAYLSRNHMIHHLKVYKPLKGDLRQAGPYKSSVEGRAAVNGLGMEWFAPILLIMGTAIAAMWALGVTLPFGALFLVAALAWGYILFGYMHDAMHLQKFWMHDNKILGPWFKNIRRLHDIHHLEFSDEGRMPTNFGICFFWFDRLFGSYLTKVRKFNAEGHQTALERYKFIIN